MAIIQDNMPGDLKAILLTVAHRNGALHLSLPSTTPVHDWWVADMYMEPAFAEGHRERIPVFKALKKKHLFQLGVNPGGHVELYAAWNDGDSSVVLVSWDTSYPKWSAKDRSDYVVGSFKGLLKRGLDRTTERAYEDERAFEKFLFDWADRAAELGAKLGKYKRREAVPETKLSPDELGEKLIEAAAAADTAHRMNNSVRPFFTCHGPVKFIFTTPVYNLASAGTF